MAQSIMVAAVAGLASRGVKRVAKSLTVRPTMAESPSLPGIGTGLDTLVVKRKKAAWILIGTIVLLLVLFDVRVNFQFSLPVEKSVLDTGQEARYAACYAERDKEIHNLAFGTIDNPDVQKLYILNHRKQAVTECRLLFPERLIMVEEPFRFNLVDLHFRFQQQD